MASASRSQRIACSLFVVVLGGSDVAQAVFYTVTGGGAQNQIGGGLPLPIQKATTMTPPTGMGAPIGTMTMFPPLLIPVNANPAKKLIQQTAGPDPKKMMVPPGVFRRVPGAPAVVGLAQNNPGIFQVRTKLSFSAPGFGSATFKAGGRTGLPTTTFVGIPASANARYSKTKAQFGGVAQAKVVAASPVRVWAHSFMAPCKHPAFAGGDAACVAQLVAAFPGSMAAPGAKAGFFTMTPGGPPPVPGVFFVSVPLATGLVAMSAPTGMGLPGGTNMATSFGLPWTTGMITLSQPSAFGAPEVFTITGMDSRLGGVGTISLVSGALSSRTVTGPNANRSWARFTLPEPTAVLSAAVAFAMLGVCYSVLNRRSR